MFVKPVQDILVLFNSKFRCVVKNVFYDIMTNIRKSRFVLWTISNKGIDTVKVPTMCAHCHNIKIVCLFFPTSRVWVSLLLIVKVTSTSV